MVDPNSPLLIFDSGIGGLSVMDAIVQRLPAAPVVYVCDHGYFPYGDRGEAELMARIPALLGRAAERFNPRQIVIACNTASTIALQGVRDALHVPVTGTVPAIKPAAELTRSGVVGLLGTAATVRQGYVDRLADQFAKGMTIIRHGDPALAPAAEAVLRGEHVPETIWNTAIAGLTSQSRGDEMDIVVLGCTHFPLVQKQLAAAAPEKLSFIDGAQGIARRVDYLCRGQRWSANCSGHDFVTTGTEESLEPYRDALTARNFARFTLL